MSEERDGWRECADPAELAAAVAAGVEVQRNWGYDWQPGTNNETAEQFAGCTKANCRYRVPASWSWSPEPPAPVTGDDLRERIARAIYAEDGWGDPWEGTGTAAIKYGRMADAVLAVLPTPAAPAPPWPGAVLSGCVDEDGVPTWLAQAGQVRGEQVRLMAGSEMWMTCSRGWSAIRWVEVRAPRAVPEPETELVPWWEAKGRTSARPIDGPPPRKHPDPLRITTVGDDGSGPHYWCYAHGALPAKDGLVEVLKDGER